MDNLKLQSHFSDRTQGAGTTVIVSARIRKIAEAFRGMKGRRIIDWGGGNGIVSALLPAGNEICVVDCSNELLAQAAARGFKTVKINEEDECPSSLAGWADALLCGETIEHVVDTDKFLDNLNQSMKMGGKLVLTTPNIYNLLTPILWLLDRPPMFAARYRSEHVRDFTVSTLKSALKNNGFRVERVRGTTLLSIPFHIPGGDVLADFLPRLSEQLVVIATKTEDSHYDPNTAVQGRLDDSPIAGAFGPAKKR